MQTLLDVVKNPQGEDCLWIQSPDCLANAHMHALLHRHHQNILKNDFFTNIDHAYVWGIGCTHFLKRHAYQMRNMKHAVMYHSFRSDFFLPDADDESSALFQPWTSLDYIFLDDIDHIQQISWALKIFQCYQANLRTCWILGAHIPPHQLSIPLPDLTSRWMAHLAIALPSLTESQKIEAIIKRALHFGVTVRPSVVTSILQWMPSDLRLLMPMIDQWIDLARKKQKKPTLALFRSIHLTC